VARSTDEARLAGAHGDAVPSRWDEDLEKRGRRVPAWAWMNLLAHGSEHALRLATRSRFTPILEVNVWHLARRYLASEVLEVADRAGSLTSLQARVLVPLELELLVAPLSPRPRPGPWAADVLTAIEAHPLSQPHRRSEA
jgi:hypothetical protein